MAALGNSLPGLAGKCHRVRLPNTHLLGCQPRSPELRKDQTRKRQAWQTSLATDEFGFVCHPTPFTIHQKHGNTWVARPSRGRVAKRQEATPSAFNPGKNAQRLAPLTPTGGHGKNRDRRCTAPENPQDPAKGRAIPSAHDRGHPQRQPDAKNNEGDANRRPPRPRSNLENGIGNSTPPSGKRKFSAAKDPAPSGSVSWPDSSPTPPRRPPAGASTDSIPAP